jgi:hypothetical protein
MRQRGVRVNGDAVDQEEIAVGEARELVIEVGRRRAVRAVFEA